MPHLRARLAIWICAVLLALGAPPQAEASRNAAPDLCRAAAMRAARATGVPLRVLMAIALTETGRRMDGALAPWPWTLNIAGKGYWLDTAAAALDMAERTRVGGQNSFDVGCFQINYRWHGEAFSSLAEMMDPDANAAYAARFLAGLYQETGSWSQAAGSYHSRTQVHASRYREIFDSHFAKLETAPLPETVQVAKATPNENRYPLLQAGSGPSRLGSLVPSGTTGGGGLFANRTTGPFWSGS